MKKLRSKKSMTLGYLTVYLKDFIKMGFVSEHIDDKGNQIYKLTELGEKSGLKDLSNGILKNKPQL